MNDINACPFCGLSGGTIMRKIVKAPKFEKGVYWLTFECSPCNETWVQEMNHTATKIDGAWFTTLQKGE